MSSFAAPLFSNLRPPHDRVQRRTQLVGHHRHELVFAPAGPLGIGRSASLGIRTGARDSTIAALNSTSYLCRSETVRENQDDPRDFARHGPWIRRTGVVDGPLPCVGGNEMVLLATDDRSLRGHGSDRAFDGFAWSLSFHDSERRSAAVPPRASEARQFGSTALGTRFMNTTRPSASVAITASPMLSSVRSSHSRLCGESLLGRA